MEVAPAVKLPQNPPAVERTSLRACCVDGSETRVEAVVEAVRAALPSAPKAAPKPETSESVTALTSTGNPAAPPPLPYPPVAGLYDESEPIPPIRPPPPPPMLPLPTPPMPPPPPPPNLAAILALASSRNLVCRATYCSSVSPVRRSMPLGSSPALPAAAPPPAPPAPPLYPPLAGALGAFFFNSVGSGRPSALALRTSL
mmetsp:Transcript_3213/g.7396  ORF Transcript_3213/g.7396 Transcript_3213/m.7396 type:complete len:200 (-) Transcript_3213:374-973(-)